MNKYQFPSSHLAPVTAHIAAYDFVVLSLTPIGTDYVIETDQAITVDEVAHLNEQYELVEVA